MPRFLRSVLLLFVFALAGAAHATTVVPPRHLGQLARMSRAVVLARAVDVWTEDRGLPMTITVFELVQAVGGARTRVVFEVEVPGGVIEDKAAVVAGAPGFRVGRNYLLFLARAPRHRWRPQMLADGAGWQSETSGIYRSNYECREVRRFPSPAELRQNLAAMKTTSEPLHYTEAEIRSFLPTGWDLIGDRPDAWDPKKKVWRATLIDNVDFDWPLEVEASAVEKLGRMEALRQAIDRVYRERLG